MSDTYNALDEIDFAPLSDALVDINYGEDEEPYCCDRCNRLFREGESYKVFDFQSHRAVVCVKCADDLDENGDELLQDNDGEYDGDNEGEYDDE